MDNPPGAPPFAFFAKGEHSSSILPITGVPGARGFRVSGSLTGAPGALGFRVMGWLTGAPGSFLCASEPALSEPVASRTGVLCGKGFLQPQKNGPAFAGP